MNFFGLAKILIVACFAVLSSEHASGQYFAQLSYQLWNGDCPKDVHDPHPGLTPRYEILCADSSPANRLRLMTESYGAIAENAFLAGLAEERSKQLECVQTQIITLQSTLPEQTKFIDDFTNKLLLLCKEKRFMTDFKKGMPGNKNQLDQYEKSRSRAALLYQSLSFKELGPFQNLINYALSQSENYAPDRLGDWFEKKLKLMLGRAITDSTSEIKKNKAVLDRGVKLLGVSFDSDTRESLAQDTDLIEQFRHNHKALESDIKPTLCRVDAKYGRGAQSRDRTLMALSLIGSVGEAGAAKIAGTLADSITGAAALGKLSLRTADFLRVLNLAGMNATNLQLVTKACFTHEQSLAVKTSQKEVTCNAHILANVSTDNCILAAGLTALGFVAVNVTSKKSFEEIQRSAAEAEVKIAPEVETVSANNASQSNAQEIADALKAVSSKPRDQTQMNIWKLAEGGDVERANALSLRTEQELRESKIISSPFLKDDPELRSASQPRLVTLENGLQGIWKPMEGHLTDGNAEIAAYTVDRMIGLNQVPITVERELNGVRGSLQLFVNDADKVRLMKKPENLSFFDTLIDNVDRNSHNHLNFQGRVVSVDHSLSFDFPTKGFEHPDFSAVVDPIVNAIEPSIKRLKALEARLQVLQDKMGKDSDQFKSIANRMQKEMSTERDSIGRAKSQLSVLIPDREIYLRFKNTTDQQWVEFLKGRLNDSQIKNFLARRDQIMKSVDRATNVFGDSAFRDGPTSPLVRIPDRYAKQIDELNRLIEEAKKRNGPVEPGTTMPAH